MCVRGEITVRGAHVRIGLIEGGDGRLFLLNVAFLGGDDIIFFGVVKLLEI